MKPVICLTMGDPAGIGAEIIVKTLARQQTYEQHNPLVVGSSAVMADALRICNMQLSLNVIKQVSDARFSWGTIDVFESEKFDSIDVSQLQYGKVDVLYGKVSGQYIEQAVDLALSEEVDAIVTAPIQKESFDLAGYGKKYRGHTEMLAGLTNTQDYAMMLLHGHIRVIHVTTHVSLRRAVDLIKKDRVLSTIRLAHEGCQQLGIVKPRIAVAGLNPHCGEGGIMGEEDIKEIVPAIEEACSLGLDVTGPIPSDTVFPKIKGGMYDVVIAMYHDQGHIPLKFAGFIFDDTKAQTISGVNTTIGLPIIRTSVDHGTAFGKAGKGFADETSLIEAISCAGTIACNRFGDRFAENR
jgi:4-hydroxythreonine-4-phosphate dehydrogenase